MQFVGLLADKTHTKTRDVREIRAQNRFFVDGASVRMSSLTENYHMHVIGLEGLGETSISTRDLSGILIWTFCSEKKQ